MKDTRTPDIRRRIIVVLAVFEPNRDFLDQQIASIAAQSRPPDGVIFVNADLRSEALLHELAAATELGFTVHTPKDRLDATAAFEAGLAAAIADTGPEDLIALSDQDDIWDRDRLRRGEEMLLATGAGMVHSDARIIDETGSVVHTSLFDVERRKRRAGLRELLYRNTVTGMTTLMRRDVVEAALPFPRQAGRFYFHDLWLALVAEAMGGLHFIDEPLVAYRQHGGNVIGALDGSSGLPRRGTWAWLRAMAGSYFVSSYLAKSLYLRMCHRIEAKGGFVDRKRLRRLAPYLSIRGAGLPFLADACRLAIGGRRRMADYAFAFFVVRVGRLVWALRAAGRPRIMPELIRFDERGYSLAPGVAPDPTGTSTPVHQVARSWTEFHDARMSPKWTTRVDASEPERFNVLLPTLNPTEVFAGIATAIDIGLAIAAKGRHVRFIATDLPVASPLVSREFVLDRMQASSLKADLTRRIDILCSHAEDEVAFSPSDRFLATAWWTSHLASEVLASGAFRTRRFYYLIQDYEPHFYPWGDENARATASYDLAFEPIFNTTVLRDFFALRGYPFATPDAPALQPSIDISTYALQRRHGGGARRRLVVYGRPEVPRNLFPIAVQSIGRFLAEQKLGPKDIELLSVGLPHDPIEFFGGHRLVSRGKLPWSEYPAFLAGVDVGLSLMLSPHPSHPPIEMAAAGARVVTNSFGSKDLSTLSPAILSAAPNSADVAKALARAWTLPPPGEADRDIDLGRIGRPLGDVVDDLLSDLSSRRDSEPKGCLEPRAVEA